MKLLSTKPTKTKLTQLVKVAFAKLAGLKADNANPTTITTGKIKVKLKPMNLE